MRKLSKIAGVTLIEMLIGVAVSSIMIAAMYSSYTVINNSYSKVTDVASISRSGRDIVAMLMRDIRMAGYKYYYGYNVENEALTLDQRIPRQDYLQFVAGEEDTADDKLESHVPIAIYRSTLNYVLSGTEPKIPGYDDIDTTKTFPLEPGETEDFCCDRIHIVYGDFDASDTEQPYKKYRITYFAKPLQKNDDQYYGVFRSKEYWLQNKNDPVDIETGIQTGKWIFTENEDENCGGDCYEGELIREHLSDMSFVAIGKYGEVINAIPANEKIYDIRSIDITLTFRSGTKKGFFRKFATAAEPRIVKSLGRKAKPFLDKFLRDSIFVTVHTRNIGGLL